jgi:hypothetical protein
MTYLLLSYLYIKLALLATINYLLDLWKGVFYSKEYF